MPDPSKSLVTQKNTETPVEQFSKIANRLIDAINLRKYDNISRYFNSEMADLLPKEKFFRFIDNLSEKCGVIRKIGSPIITPPSRQIFEAVFPAYFECGVIDIKIGFDNENKISTLNFMSHEDIPVPNRHKAELNLPFKGKWLVFWGGDTELLNRHHDTLNQRFAFDFVVVDESGLRHKNDGTKNEDYYAYGKEILSPGSGLVTDVIQEVRDNRPGSKNKYSALGNAVFIQHRKLEFSILAHLKPNETKVKVGDKIEPGQVIGLCGNSGNTSEPHLHFHLQNTPIIQDGTGIKCYFKNITVTRNGENDLKKMYSPIKGEIVSSSFDD